MWYPYQSPSACVEESVPLHPIQTWVWQQVVPLVLITMWNAWDIQHLLSLLRWFILRRICAGWILGKNFNYEYTNPLTCFAQAACEVFVTGVFKDRLCGNPSMGYNCGYSAVFSATFSFPHWTAQARWRVTRGLSSSGLLFSDLLNEGQISPCLMLVFLDAHLFVKKTLGRHSDWVRGSKAAVGRASGGTAGHGERLILCAKQLWNVLWHSGDMPLLTHDCLLGIENASHCSEEGNSLIDTELGSDWIIIIHS